MPRTFDELHDADAAASPQHAQRQAECCRGLTLAGAGVDDEKSFLDGLFSDFGILNGFALRHLGAMASAFSIVDVFWTVSSHVEPALRSSWLVPATPIGFARRLSVTVAGTSPATTPVVERSKIGAGHLASFTATGKPATIRTTRPARAAIRWLSRPCMSRKRLANALSGTMPKPTSLETRTTGARRLSSEVSRRAISTSRSAPASMRFDSQRVRQSTRTGASVATAASAVVRS